MVWEGQAGGMGGASKMFGRSKQVVWEEQAGGMGGASRRHSRKDADEL